MGILAPMSPVIIGQGFWHYIIGRGKSISLHIGINVDPQTVAAIILACHNLHLKLT